MTWVLYHARQGFLGQDSLVTIPLSSLLGATVDGGYLLSDEIKIVAAPAHAATFPAHHVKQAREMAAKLNAKEMHHHWRAVRSDQARELLTYEASDRPRARRLDR